MTNMLTMATMAQIVQNRKLPCNKGTSLSAVNGTVKFKTSRKTNHISQSQNFLLMMISFGLTT